MKLGEILVNLTFNPFVVGSTPARPTKIVKARYPKDSGLFAFHVGRGMLRINGPGPSAHFLPWPVQPAAPLRHRSGPWQ